MGDEFLPRIKLQLSDGTDLNKDKKNKLPNKEVNKFMKNKTTLFKKPVSVLEASIEEKSDEDSLSLD